GSSWTSINGNFPTDLPVNSVAIDPSNDLNLYIGTDLGMWSTADGGATWIKDDGFPNSAVVMLGVTSNNYLVAATHGRSMFKAALNTGPFITVTSPNGGENWNVGTTHNITWSQGGIANVMLEYSTNAGSTWSTIISSIPASAGTYAWTIPNTLTSQALVRVSDASNASLNDISNGTFTISPPPSVTVTSPNGGEAWNTLSVHNITWTSVGITNVKIEYSTNNGSTWSTIVASTAASAGSYAWTVPNTPTTQASVRVSDASNASTNDVSNAVFSIVTVPAITVATPNGGETWIAGSLQNITWTFTSVTNVKIEYSTNNGTNWLTVTGSIPASAGSYTWTVPNTPTSQALVRLSDAANAATNDVSNAVFTIAPPPGITLTSPNGGESWNVLSSHAITWSSVSITNTKIEYSTNNGSSWNLVTASIPASAGTYAWTVPNTPTTQALVRVSDASNATVNDPSDAVFTIVTTPAVSVLSPNGGESWTAGSAQNITWASVNVANVKIEYSTDNGTSWSSITATTPASTGSYSWVVPNTPSIHSRVRISDATNASTSDMSDASFTIAAPTGITVTSPNGGEIWNASTVHNITWTAAGVNNVKIKYSTTNGTSWSTITSNTPASTGSYAWTVPGIASTQAKVQVSNSNGSISDISDGTFTISTTSAAITVTAPNGGEQWPIGTTQNITWSSTGIADVNIEYSTDGGSSWSTIVSSAAAPVGNYAWTIPDTPTSQALVRISDASNPSVSDMSNSVFSIAVSSAITLTAPNGGEILAAGNAFTISWTSTSIGYIRIEYSTDNGGNWILIESNLPAAPASYSWTVPNTPTTSGLMRVSDALKFVPSDQSDNPFSITGMQFLTSFICSDNGSTADTLYFGEAIGATNGIDSLLGELELPPKPSAGTFDVRWTISGTRGIRKDVRDTLGSIYPQAVYACELQAGSGGYPFTLAWGSLGKGVWTLRDATTHGALFKSRMRSGRSYIIKDPSIASVEIVHDKGKTQTATVAASWNMVSTPLYITDDQTQEVFSGAVSPAYFYTEAGYQLQDSIVEGRGYWLKFAMDQTVEITGEPIVNDTIDLISGWNMIGSNSDAVSTGSIASIPQGIVAPTLFGFENGVYTMTDSIYPAKGYWVKTTQAGQLILSSGNLQNSIVFHDNLLLKQLDLNELTVRNHDGIEQTLYFGENPNIREITPAAFELPPLPPNEIFDVRFTSQKMVELFQLVQNLHLTYPIAIQSDAYPLTVSWNITGTSGAHYFLTDGLDGKVISDLALSGKGDVRISNPHITTLLLNVEVSEEKPANFSLWQNYPNPFNPSTNIKFDLPERGLVTLRLSDVLGQVTLLLLDQRQFDAGTHLIELDAKNLSSGIYFYQISVQGENASFADRKKMLLVK
ncbi:MAG TPA: T9SS type A sorting domain-containing protein, partial [Bacteroidota bacterium]|nr:T9SS type A sorting domain-containing protein [Bacteroidota bacterium]